MDPRDPGPGVPGGEGAAGRLAVSTEQAVSSEAKNVSC